MNIRNAMIEDAQKLQSYLSEIIDEGLPTLFNREKVPTTEAWEKFIEKFISSHDSILLVAEYENEIIGVLNFSSNRQPQCSHGGDFTVTITEHWRSRGVGTSLIESLLSWVNKHDSIFRVELEVFSNNQKAIKLYEKLGFFHEGVKRKAVLVANEFIDVIQMAWLKTKK
jgi:RimJ/RimL family protein N-acetyltransferase